MAREDVLDRSLDSLRAALAADQFDLRLAAVEPSGEVRIILAAKPGACVDCLVPDALLVTMIEDALRQSDPTVGQVELVKEGV